MGIEALQSHMEPNKPGNLKINYERSIEVSQKVVLSKIKYLEIENKTSSSYEHPYYTPPFCGIYVLKKSFHSGAKQGNKIFMH